MKQLYQVDKDGKITMLISLEEYRRIMFKLSVDPDIIYNPFINKFMNFDMTFNHNGVKVLISSCNHRGNQHLVIEEDDVEVVYEVMDDMYDTYFSQITLWVRYGIVLSSYLRENGMMTDDDLINYCSCFFYPPVGERTEWDVIEVRPDYYIHKMDDKWCLYHWVSGEKEVCMDLYESGDLKKVITTFRKKVDKLSGKTKKPTTKWSEVIYKEDGTFKLKQIK